MLERYLQAVAELEERFSGPTERRDLLTAVAVAAVAFAVYAVLTPAGLASADAAVYLQQIRQADFASRPTHTGYYLLGWLWSWLAGESEWALNLMSSAFAAAALGVVWLHAQRLARRRIAAGFAVAVAAVHALLASNALHAEVYMAEAALILAALHVWLRGYAVAAGLLLALAALVTPSAAFVAPAFVLLRPRLRELALLGVAGALVVALGIAPLGAHYFSGGRGLLSGAAAHLGLFGGLKKEGMEVVLGAASTVAWIGAGALVACRRSVLWPWLAAFSTAWTVSFVLGERFGDVPVQLPLHLWGCCLAAVALAELPKVVQPWTRSRRNGLLASLAAVGSVPFVLVYLFRDELQAAASLPGSAWLALAFAMLLAGALSALAASAEQAVRALAAASVATTLVATVAQGASMHRDVVSFRNAVSETSVPEPLAVGGWSPGILFEHYRYGSAYTDQWIDRRELDEEGVARIEAALRDGREVWLLDGPLPESVDVRTASREQRGPIVVLRGR